MKTSKKSTKIVKAAKGTGSNAAKKRATGTSTRSMATMTNASTGASQKGTSQAGASQDPIEMLKADHRKVENLFTQYEAAPNEEQKQKIAEQICTELTVHALLEEEIFYPACRQEEVEEELLDEAQIEHDTAKILINELKTQEPDSEMYDAKVKVLAEYVKHHVSEEEGSDGIFANVRKTDVDMKGLGQRLAQRKQELMAEAEADELDPQAPRMLHLDALAQHARNQEYSTMARQSNYRRRDEMGRFTDDDDDRGSSRYSSRGRYEEDDDDDRGRGRGWYGDSEGHSQAARSRSSSRYSSRREEDDDDDRRGGGRDHGQGGWFGDPRGHSMAARRGWEERGSSRYEDDDDDYRSRGSRSRSSSRYEDDDDDYRGRSSSRSRSSSRYEEDDDDEGRGWHGDPRGHAEAARRGWETREREGTARSRSSSRYEDDDDDDRRGGSRGSREGHGGWFGDPEGHSQASRRGWRNR